MKPAARTAPSEAEAEADAISAIVHRHCHHLLAEMRTAHPSVQDDLGISVALFYPGRASVQKFYHYGRAGAGGAKIDSSTVYAMGSVTKVFTATLAAWLTASKAIGPLNSETVATYLNEFVTPSDYWDGATFQDFATQTSGMPDPSPKGAPSQGLFDGTGPDVDFVNWWNDTTNQTAWTNQAPEWVYSNPGFVTLGFAVVAAAQQTLNDPSITYAGLLSGQITDVLGMQDSFVGSVAPAGLQLSDGYNTASKQVSILRAVDLKSSARDIHAFMAAVYEAMQLQSEQGQLTDLQMALAATTANVIENPIGPGAPANMGLAWQINADQVLHKNGATGAGGSTCNMLLSRYNAGAQGLGIVVMTNQDGYSPDPTATNIFNEIAMMF